ncbi:MAG: plastocyanin/azurin family copper-binding protein [Dehalococcoidia bacterium]
MARLRRAILLPPAFLVLLALAACGGTALEEVEPEVGVTEVDVDDNTFGPRVIQVPPGTEVTWTWSGSDRHNVVGEGFKSELVRDGTFSHTFDQPGWYRYLCTLHAGMNGAVSVVAE